MVLRRCRQLLRDDQRALDALQEVFMKLCINHDKLKHEYPSSLLYTMATNISLNMIRALKNRQEHCNADELVTTLACSDDVGETVQHRSLIAKIFAHEKKSTKLMAVLHFVDGLSYEEVAQELKMSISGVRKRLRLLKERVHLTQEKVYE